MSTRTRHAVAMLAAAVMPTVVSVLLLLVVGPLLPAWGAWFVLVGWAVALALSVPPVGERWIPALVWGARRATPSEEYTLGGPVAQACHLVEEVNLRIRVTRGNDVRAYGRRTLLVGEKVVAAVRSRELATDHLAAIITHQLGLLQVGATRFDPLAHVAAWPWHTLAAIRLPLLTPAIRLAAPMRGLFVPVMLFLAWTEHDPSYLLGCGVLLLSYLPGRQRTGWTSRRRALGDEMLARTPLAAPFGQWLLARDPSPATYDRVYALLTQTHPAPWRNNTAFR